MKRKLWMGVLAFGMSIAAFAGCFNESGTQNSSSNDDSSASFEDSTVTDKVFEGEMLLNGFESIEDLYKIRQHETSNNGGSGVKFDIVGEEDFLYSDSQTKIDKANAAVAALPEASSIVESTNELRSLASKARSMYSALTPIGKTKITGVENMNAVIEKLGMKGLYTIGELKPNSCACGKDLSKGYANAGSWYSACADLIDVKEGNIAFTVAGIADNEGAMPNHALQLCLFHDSSPKTTTSFAGDGIYMRVATDSDQIYFKLAGGGQVTMPLMEKLYKDAVYTFNVGYKVAEDYSKVTISVKIIDDVDNIICNSSVDISSFSTNNLGDQTVESWLNGENKAMHKGFLIDTGTSSGVTVKGLWDGYAWEENEGEVERNQTDLSPRQGDKALRIKYDAGEKWEYILARFSISDLAGLPTEKLGGMSIKVYNDNPETKEITFSVMRDYGNVIELDDATFELAPYAWTTCSMYFDPNIIQYYATDIVGVNVYFEDRSDAIYYLDDWKISFEQKETAEEAQKMNIFNQIKSDIDTLNYKEITVDDKADVQALYDNYMALSPLYKGMLTDYEEHIDKIYSRYIQALYVSESADEQFTLLPLDETIGLTRISKGLSMPEYVSYTTEVKSPNGNGALKVDLQAPGVTSGIDIATADGIYDELHIWVKNDSTDTRTIKFSDQVLFDFNGTAYDEYGNEVLGRYVTKDNKIVGTDVYNGWIRLVYRDYVLVKNITTTSGSGFLYIGEIYGVSHIQTVTSAIAELDDYKKGYTDEQKAKVEEVRAMYDQLAYISKSRIENREKLFEIQANIWLEDYEKLNLPLSIQTLEYDETLDIAIDDLIVRYNCLGDNGKAIIVQQYERLQSVKERYAELAAEYNDGIVTLKDLNTIDFNLSSYWSKKEITLPDALKSTVMFKITQRSQTGTGIFYLTLFFEQQNGKNEGNGIGFTISNSQVTLDGVKYDLSAPITVDTTYLFKLGYSIAPDYSSMKVNFQIGVDDGSETVISNITKEYNEISGSAIDAWIDSHNKLAVQNGQCTFRLVENAWNSFRVNKLKDVDNLNKTLTNLNGKTLDELNALQAQYEALPMTYRMMVENIDAIQEKLDEIYSELRNGKYTLKELGGKDGTISTWGNQVLTIKDNMNGALIYKMTKTAHLGTQIHSFTLFYDGTTAGSGIRMTFTINQGMTINGTKVSMSNVQPNVEYYYLISWKVAEDYSKVTVRIRVEATDGTSVLGDQTMELTSLVGADSIEDWVKANNKLLIDAQQCTFSVASAWTEFDLKKFTTVHDWEETVAGLTGEETYEELTELKATYMALPREYQLLMDYATLEKAIDKVLSSVRDNTYTLSELGGKDGTISTWGSQVLTMKDNMEGTFIYKMTKTGSSNSQIHSFTLFYDGANAGNGVRLTFQINANLKINGTTVSMSNVQPNVEYYYLISWKVAEDYSKVTVRIRVEATDGTSVLGDQTMELTSLVGAESIETWVKANNKILIDAQQCKFDIASAWSEFDVNKFTEVKVLKDSITELKGTETVEDLNKLKALYDALPRVYQLLVDNYSTLEQLLV